MVHAMPVRTHRPARTVRISVLESPEFFGRQVRGDDRGSIPSDVAPILDRPGLSDECSVNNFGRWFHGAAGHTSLLAEEASHAGKRWLQGIGHSKSLTGNTERK